MTHSLRSCGFSSVVLFLFVILAFFLLCILFFRLRSFCFYVHLFILNHLLFPVSAHLWSFNFSLRYFYFSRLYLFECGNCAAYLFYSFCPCFACEDYYDIVYSSRITFHALFAISIPTGRFNVPSYTYEHSYQYT